MATHLDTAYISLTVGPQVGTVDLSIYTRVGDEEVSLGTVSIPVSVSAVTAEVEK